ncbi:hypothetical protein [Prescottella equi]|uniref:hypothetical protein n=1 Tax=Rhodococcus hoagii TaxID=43767 RepID=UPI000A1009B3|nr:hypothetical protein [Prescottella equi]ORL34982.1 hypothetical protein A6I91_01885 [Prescottella equi]
MTVDPLEHLDFAVICDLTDNETGDCQRPATHIADIHMHTIQMPRVALCDQHVALHLALEAQIRPRAHCAVCKQLMQPDDFIRNREPL